MGCDEVIARLDAGGPLGLDPRHRAHARACAACGAALQAAEAVEAVLREAPPSPRADFAARVMERVEASERARRRMAELPRPSLWNRWWRGLAEEPAAIVALALAPVPVILAAVWPDSATALAALIREAAAAWIASATSGASLAWPGVSADQPGARVVADSVALSTLAVAFYFAIQWVGDALGGSVISARRAQRESTSRRKPS